MTAPRKNPNEARVVSAREFVGTSNAKGTEVDTDAGPPEPVVPRVKDAPAKRKKS